ncbi:hypothetical protein GCM10028895_52720 [Pontibacter rugosus]
MNELIEIAIGNDAGVLTWWQMSVRAVVVFFAALMVSFIGSNRVFSKSSFPDIVFGIMYGSVLSRAITGSSPFLPTLAAALVLVLVHKGLAVVAFHLGAGFGHFTKGEHVDRRRKPTAAGTQKALHHKRRPPGGCAQVR